MNGISFIVKTQKPIISALAVSKFIDEVQVVGSVAVDEIVGISVPEAQRNKEISALSFGFEKMPVASVEAFASEVAWNIETETGEKVDTNRMVELVGDLKKNHTLIVDEDSIEIGQLNQLFADALAKGLRNKYGIVTFAQYLEHYIGGRKTVYNLEEQRVWKPSLLITHMEVLPRNNRDFSQKKPEWNQGGIDLDAGLLNMNIKRDGAGMPLPLPMQDPDLAHIDGLSPTILDIAPVGALPIFTELKRASAGQPA